MPSVVKLAPDEQPPKDEDYVLLRRTAGGRFDANGCSTVTGEPVFYTAPPIFDRDEAVRLALAWAAEHSVETVYLSAS